MAARAECVMLCAPTQAFLSPRQVVQGTAALQQRHQPSLTASISRTKPGWVSLPAAVAAAPLVQPPRRTLLRKHPRCPTPCRAASPTDAPDSPTVDHIEDKHAETPSGSVLAAAVAYRDALVEAACWGEEEALEEADAALRRHFRLLSPEPIPSPHPIRELGHTLRWVGPGRGRAGWGGDMV